MKSTRIILTVTNDLTYDRRMDRICHTLASGGYTVTLVGRRLRDSKAFHRETYTGHRLKCWFTTGILFYAEYNIRLMFFLLYQGYDVACACDLDTVLPVSCISWLKQKKTVYDAHEFYTEAPELSGRPFVKRIWEWIARTTIPGFDLRYTVGEQLAKLMSAKYQVPFQVIRNIAPHANSGVSLTPVLDRPKVLLYQGALNVGRGLEVMIQTMTLLPEWEFWLAGEGDITTQLKEQVVAQGLQSRVKFLGWVAPDHLPALMNSARLGINLRDAGSLNDYYSLPNKFFDAIHAGLPSVNMDYPEYHAICAQYPCAILIHELSPKAIQSAIDSIDREPQRLLEMANACAHAARALNWESESAKLLDLYRTLMLSK